MKVKKIIKLFRDLIIHNNKYMKINIEKKNFVITKSIPRSQNKFVNVEHFEYVTSNSELKYI